MYAVQKAEKNSYAKLLFSTNEMPQNLEDKSDAFYRRLLILDMNRVVKSGEKDLHLKEKVQAESDYAIHMAMIALKNLYEQGKFTESEHSKECVREVQRTSDSICAFIDESLVRAKGKRLKRSEVFTRTKGTRFKRYYFRTFPPGKYSGSNPYA